MNTTLVKSVVGNEMRTSSRAVVRAETEQLNAELMTLTSEAYPAIAGGAHLAVQSPSGGMYNCRACNRQCEGSPNGPQVLTARFAYIALNCLR